MPPDTDIFLLREKEKLKKLEERDHMKHLKVHEKNKHNQKIVEGVKAGLKPKLSDDEVEEDDEAGPIKNYQVKEDKSWTIAVTRGKFKSLLFIN
jgi:hypothetical protein